MPRRARAAFVALSLATACGHAEPPMYTIQELPLLPSQPPGSTGDAYLLNNSGLIAGMHSRDYLGGSPMAGVAWNMGGPALDLTAAHPDASWVNFFDLNDQGTILAQVVLPGQPAQPIFRWRNGTIEFGFADAPPGIAGSGFVGVYCINNAGVMAGGCSILPTSGTRSISRIFRWGADGHNPLDLGNLGGDALPQGMNDSGDIVGASYLDVNGTVGAHPFVYRAGLQAMVDLSGSYVDHARGVAYAINNGGAVCGITRDPNNETVPTAWAADGTRTLLPMNGGTHGFADDINEAGIIVGSVVDLPVANGGAAIWEHGQIYEIASRVSNLAADGWDVLYRARAINDRGQIVGYGSRQVEPTRWDLRGFLLTPVTVCPANCDGSTVTPVLNIADFTCFLTKFAAGCADPAACYANCDGSTGSPFLNVADFTCFLGRFAQGCE